MAIKREYVKKENVTEHNPCPICGKGDWCMWGTTADGEEILNCHRTTAPYQKEVAGLDGRTYYGLGNGEQCGLYETLEQRQFAQAEWVKQAKASGQFDLWLEKKRKENPNYERKERKTLKPLERNTAYIDYSKFKRYGFNQVAPDNKLNAVYHTLMKKCSLYTKHAEYLIGEKWNEEMFSMYNIKSLTRDEEERIHICKSIQKELGTNALVGVPGFYENHKKEWTICGYSGILFPQTRYDGRIIRLRVRPDYSQSELDKIIAKGKKPAKYMTLSSCKEIVNKEKGLVRNFFWNGTKAAQDGSNIGAIRARKGHSSKIGYVIEGEKKSFFANYVRGVPCVILPGTSFYSELVATIPGTNYCLLDQMREDGVEILVICFDADKNVKINVLKSEKQTIKLAFEKGFKVGVSQWNLDIAKGLDDLLAQNLNPVIHFIK